MNLNVNAFVSLSRALSVSATMDVCWWALNRQTLNHDWFQHGKNAFGRVCLCVFLVSPDCCCSFSSMQMISSRFYMRTPAHSRQYSTSFYLHFEEVKLTFISHITTGDCHFRLFILIFASFACHLNDNRGYRKMVKSATDCNLNGGKKWLVSPVVIIVVVFFFCSWLSLIHAHIHPLAMLAHFAFGDRFSFCIHIIPLFMPSLAFMIRLVSMSNKSTICWIVCH